MSMGESGFALPTIAIRSLAPSSAAAAAAASAATADATADAEGNDPLRLWFGA